MDKRAGVRVLRDQTLFQTHRGLLLRRRFVQSQGTSTGTATGDTAEMLQSQYGHYSKIILEV